MTTASFSKSEYCYRPSTFGADLMMAKVVLTAKLGGKCHDVMLGYV